VANYTMRIWQNEYTKAGEVESLCTVLMKISGYAQSSTFTIINILQWLDCLQCKLWKNEQPKHQSPKL